ncbi:CU044_5270 family protein [Streptomyces sp. Amel2xE9]|uniref:CU044_5270 family protein n=1 Tax=unclassified Streptomyces TaxID=2593676 RepID=UPI0018F8AF2B|nr:CU044_5270 family protein [Streptomyces sp. Amel2xE9]
MRDLDQTLRAMNPARDGRPADQARLENILATSRASGPARRPRGRNRWTWTAAAATVTAAALAYVTLDPFGTTAQPAFAVTPQPLQPQKADRPAAEVLEAIAGRIDQQPDPRPAPWKTEHFVWDSWALSTRIDNIQVTSAVIPEHRETWEKPDGSARWKASTLPPVFQSGRQREVWEKAGSVGKEPQRSSGSSGPVAVSAVEPPTTVEGMRTWLANGQNMGAGLLFEVVPERFQDHVLSPAQRAALLRVLASTKGVVYAGTVKDRAGRSGEAFSLTDRFGGLPNKRTLVFDPATGDLRAYEEQLQDDPGRLNVRPYSVIEYTTFLTAERLP